MLTEMESICQVTDERTTDIAVKYLIAVKMSGELDSCHNLHHRSINNKDEMMFFSFAFRGKAYSFTVSLLFSMHKECKHG